MVVLICATTLELMGLFTVMNIPDSTCGAGASGAARTAATKPKKRVPTPMNVARAMQIHSGKLRPSTGDIIPPAPKKRKPPVCYSSAIGRNCVEVTSAGFAFPLDERRVDPAVDERRVRQQFAVN